MRGVGLSMLIAHMQKRGQMKKCDRCGLKYQAKEEHCPHCHNMSEADLMKFKEKIALQHEGNRSIGNMFILAAVVLLVLIMAVSL